MYCEHCGIQLDDDDSFCTSCGTNTAPATTAVHNEPPIGQPRPRERGRPEVHERIEVPSKSKARLLLGGVLLCAIAAAVVIFLIPVPYTATETYTFYEPYETTETYTDQEP